MGGGSALSARLLQTSTRNVSRLLTFAVAWRVALTLALVREFARSLDGLLRNRRDAGLCGTVGALQVSKREQMRDDSFAQETQTTLQ